MTEIDELLDRIDPPPADVADDVTRGEQALRRRRRWQVAAAALSVASLAGASLALTGTHGSPTARPPFSAQPSTGSATASPSSKTTHDAKTLRRNRADQQARHRAERGFLPSMDAVDAYRDVLAEHLDPHGDLLAPASNEQGGTQLLGSKLDWNHGGMLEIVVGRRWEAVGGFYLIEDAGMKPTTYDGHAARVSTTGADMVVSVEHDDGTIVTLVASTNFGNNGTTGSTSYLTEQRLLDAAADPRLKLPDSVR